MAQDKVLWTRCNKFYYGSPSHSSALTSKRGSPIHTINSQIVTVNLSTYFWVRGVGQENRKQNTSSLDVKNAKHHLHGYVCRRRTGPMKFALSLRAGLNWPKPSFSDQAVVLHTVHRRPHHMCSIMK